ncbi:Prostaglandin reductase 1 [Orchesella cincta]|uniref:15-oxoprostaglandin 13-reductase n=1 Tax=Orchesella cincta TaxID=48709 RepID=A0A1D2N3D2_ORCCI|nr:Prostaglandin reductase 1 [Orchesella cincta]
MKAMFSAVFPLPDLKGLPDSYALGACGLTGLSAYFGLIKVCQPKSGETVVVSSAAGAVGSLAGQIAKIKGCKVVGFAGSEEKVSWIKDELGFKFAFNYKEVHADSILKKYAVEGVDCYFDSVGGEFTYNVLRNMNEFGRVALCGAISTYNDPKDNKVPFDYQSMIYKQLRLEGFMVNRWFSEFPEGVGQLAEWIHQGKLKVRETKTQGFENMPQAFLDLFKGKNFGKAIVVA